MDNPMPKANVKPSDQKPRKRFTLEQLEEAAELYNGFCLSCGAEREECEPDAERYPCPECGENEVFGAEQILLTGLVKPDQ
jgi:predicted RNA-binding Zn-ribbon protein involved in translation (DUF1610 family)